MKNYVYFVSYKTINNCGEEVFLNTEISYKVEITKIEHIEDIETYLKHIRKQRGCLLTILNYQLLRIEEE